ncbi:Fe-S protein assembly co-chaperone HscB [Klebsiella pneumoniae]|mgnify:FL=1|uniref:Fe-S protein assembly co-chaperone HscB n=1 Tax=Klebsiella pneumoniae TaxID=573 RepID=UPI0023AF3C67|nr:Fe-S protein assembly co-chaperone HscB [Klebsiella pneumoniae]MDE9122220.1 Fe-S protein assembly co-chaperone HscB [Klebsiella pneumoniae]
MDYFTLFGLPASYTLSLEQLAVRYQDLQRQYHPDKFTSAPAAEQLAAVQHSATINQAWQTLRKMAMDKNQRMVEIARALLMVKAIWPLTPKE